MLTALSPLDGAKNQFYFLQILSALEDWRTNEQVDHQAG